MDRIHFWMPAQTVAGKTTTANATEHSQESPAELRKALAEGKAVLIDVREANEWENGHIRDARHLALSELMAGVPSEKLNALISEKKTVYLHCAAGGRCLKAAELLKVAGYDARPLKAGYEALIRDGFEKVK